MSEIRVGVVAEAIRAVLQGASVDTAANCLDLTRGERVATVNLAAQGACWSAYERLGEGLALWRVLSLAGEPSADLEHADLLARFGDAARRWIAYDGQ